MLATASFQPSRPHVLATPFPSPSRTHPALDYSNTPEATPPPLNNPSPRFRCLTIFAFSCFSNRAVSPRHRDRPNPIIQVREELEKALRPDLQEPTFELIQLEVQRRYYAKWHTALSSRPPYLHDRARVMTVLFPYWMGNSVAEVFSGASALSAPSAFATNSLAIEGSEHIPRRTSTQIAVAKLSRRPINDEETGCLR
ncbi:hypothetical protein FA13DRAFT_280987 [Coprinellus micaceus]|uniref:Uncharacterized protein n=1 Tax=Coprinellus micaceus TaxID=71717 RepID=A0A4Y7SFZ1_COPMI|nr:hypothetical protein FA13DRAFT_280987 [Coprinellus micaceus]